MKPRHGKLLWLWLPFACSPGEPPPSWHSTGFAWSRNGAHAAVGEAVTADVSLGFEAVVCHEPSGCDSGGCETLTRQGEIDPGSLACAGAGCSLEVHGGGGFGVGFTVRATLPGRVIVRARGRDPETRKTYEGEMHVDFVDADEIAWLRHPLAAPGASDAILVDSQFEWCLEVRGSSTEGKRVKLLASPRIEVSPELAVDQSPSEWRPSRAGCHRVNARRPGPALIGASFGAVERSVPLEIVTSEAVVGATIRRFSDARALPPWLPVEENLVDGFSEPLSGLDLLVGASRELYVLTLELEGGMTSHAGVGALTVGPSGVARLVDVVVDTRGETPAILFDPTTLDSSAPLVTRSLFSVVPVAPGRAELEFALGSAKLNLPIEVTAAAGTGGTGSGTGGSAGRAGEGGSGGDAGAPDGGAPEAGAGGDAESAGNGGSEGGAAGR